MNDRTQTNRCQAGLLSAVASCMLLAVAAIPAAIGDEPHPDPQEAAMAAEKAAREAEVAQRQSQIEQHRKAYEQSTFQPLLEGDLELVRTTCGSLPPAARREILAAGKEAASTAAKQLAESQFGGQPRKPFNYGQQLHDAIRDAVKPHATPEEFAAYERERAARLSRRDRVARLSILAKLHQELLLSGEQRAAIAARLEKEWDAAWLVELHDRGGDQNGWRLAPDFAEHCITSHLDERQLARWKTWCEQASLKKRMGMMHNVNLGWQQGGSTLDPDPWWTP